MASSVIEVFSKHVVVRSGGSGLFSAKYARTFAIFSQDFTYRYVLVRQFDDEPRSMLAVIGLNPSTADENVNDPTVARCENRARKLGYGGLAMLNLFAIRSTDPKGMLSADDPVGESNDEALWHWTQGSDVLCAWGCHGFHRGRDWAVWTKIKDRCRPLCVGTTLSGAPRHPLYVPSAQALLPFEMRAR